MTTTQVLDNVLSTSGVNPAHMVDDVLPRVQFRQLVDFADIGAVFGLLY